MLVAAGALVLVIGGYGFGWDWTGLGASPKSNTMLPAKSVWDWLQLLIIPAALGLGTLWFNAQQSQRQQRLSDQQHAADQRRADEQHVAEQKLAEHRRETDLELAQDQQRETMLQAYLDRMADLLLQRQLGTSQKEDEIRQVARARTLTILRRLDAERKTALVRFLVEAQLVGNGHNIISLGGVDLSEADLSRTNLIEADLNGANLSEALQLHFFILSEMPYNS